MVGVKLYESFMKHHSYSCGANQGNGPKVDCLTIKNVPLKAILYDKDPIISHKDKDQSGETCVKTCHKESSSNQRWLKQVRNELAWVGMNISQYEDNIEQLMKEGKQSLADIKLILKMVSRLTFIFQIIFEQNKHSVKDQEGYINAREACKKYTDFLVKAFQK